MSKELEALLDIKENYKFYVHNKKPIDYQCEIIKKALQRLETLDNAKPSEALECLEKVNDYLNNVYDYKEIIEEVKKDINTIKQALLKAQEQEKVLEIIKEKYVDFFQFPCCRNVYEYNDLKFSKHEKITQEEFDTLKRWLGND